MIAVTVEAKRKATKAELALAQQVVAAAGSGDVVLALALADKGARKFPDFTVPAANEGDPEPSFAQVAAFLRAKQDAATAEQVQQEAPAPVVESAPVQRKPAPRRAAKAAKAVPVAVPEPVVVEPTVLRLVHNGVEQTSIFGVPKDSPAHRAIGSKRNGGLGWIFYKVAECFYIPKSGGVAPDYVAINLAISVLENLRGDDGQPLYRVEREIRAVDADGKPLPVRMSEAEAQRWQRKYDAARNTLWAAMGLRSGRCGKCGAGGLDQQTGRIGKGDDGMPEVECYTCGGFAGPVAPVAAPVVQVAPVVEAAPVTAPVMDLSAMLALPAVATPLPESAECPSCRQPVPVSGGRLALHNGRYGNGACRGKLGVTVTDVEPEPAAPTGKAARKATAPAVDAPEAGDGAGVVLRFALQAGLSNSARNDTATEVRQAITRKVTYGKVVRGVRVETRRDKVNHQLVMTVTEGGASYGAAEVADEIAAAVKGVRGVGNRVWKG